MYKIIILFFLSFFILGCASKSHDIKHLYSDDLDFESKEKMNFKYMDNGVIDRFDFKNNKSSLDLKDDKGIINDFDDKYNSLSNDFNDINHDKYINRGKSINENKFNNTKSYNDYNDKYENIDKDVFEEKMKYDRTFFRNKNIEYNFRDADRYNEQYVKFNKSKESDDKNWDTANNIFLRILNFPVEITNFLFLPFDEEIDKKYEHEKTKVMKNRKKESWE